MGHHHHHGHFHHRHSHSGTDQIFEHDEPGNVRHTHVKPQGAARALLIAFAVTGGYALVEAIGGWWAGSLALMSDAGHMATDAGALLLALLAQHIAGRPPTPKASYGYARAEVLGAFVNALAMLGVVVWIVVEAVQRLLNPAAVKGEAVMLMALIGMIVNIVVLWSLSGHGGLNSRAAVLHVLGDLLGSVAAIAAGAVIHFTGWTPIDPILSIGVCLLILSSTVALLRQSTEVLMEAVPSRLPFEEIGRRLAAIRGVRSVHDLHIWTMAADRVALSAHLVIADAEAWPAVLAEAQRMLAEHYEIRHITLQPGWSAAPPARSRVVPIVAKGPRPPHLH